MTDFIRALVKQIDHALKTPLPEPPKLERNMDALTMNLWYYCNSLHTYLAELTEVVEEQKQIIINQGAEIDALRSRTAVTDHINSLGV